ncbi:TetR-like C-terminal domain-containing protein [Companilactobacillus versmoldensis]|uniref:Regulatory protein TetR n=1 Tax=Companilactobacillus versmoldensis DSM 14857 = KCTC 3814 TaxID=1423815 RepID=A0A0R1SES3_9LACO|nr:TetR/AcrR family transcriptional regulator [Companilactobacillus versmoldensis]KRL67648.1 regulatory protein TetR [Companilactobacillus versmoldensis DSM 14857 = KCTC 3814]
MMNIKNNENLTLQYLIDILEAELSSKIIPKFTMTQLMKTSGKSRSTIYYHFAFIDDAYKYYFEKRLLKEIASGCHCYNDVVVSFVDTIIANKNLCLNLYNLSDFLHHPDYLLDLFTRAFNDHEIPEHKLSLSQKHLLSGIVFLVKRWFDQGLKTKREEMITQLIEHGDLVKTYKKAKV